MRFRLQGKTTSGDNPRNEWKASPYANLLGQKAPGLLLQNLKPTSDENAAQFVDGAVHGSPGRWRTDAPDTVERLLTFASVPLSFTRNEKNFQCPGKPLWIIWMNPCCRNRIDLLKLTMQ